ncbi:hypothetical protein J8J27_23975, partial [Mycobacterium tuberculosis]|nr:hypothetical protein [Mycobacterium tuberculosis]
EDGFGLVECFDPVRNTCPMIDACRLRDTLKRATDAFLAVLDDTTLADLVGHGETVLAVLDRRRAALGCAGPVLPAA